MAARSSTPALRSHRTAEGDATGPQCFAFHTLPGFIDPYETFLDEGGMLMGEAALRESGIEVNGRIVDRYAITIDNIDPNDDSGSEVDDLTEAYIDIDRRAVRRSARAQRAGPQRPAHRATGAGGGNRLRPGLQRVRHHHVAGGTRRLLNDLSRSRGPWRSAREPR